MIFSLSFVKLLLKRIIEFLTSLVILATLTFFLLKALPGSPFDEEVALSLQVKEQLVTKWDLNSPVWVQWLSYMKNILRGDLGQSMISPEKSVTEIIRQNISYSATLNISALLLVIICSVILSIFAFKVKGTRREVLLDQFFIAGVSLPSLFWGPLIIYFLAYKFEIFPLAFLESPMHYVLPLLALCLRPVCVLARFLKNSMMEIQNADFVRTAVAKGVSSWGVLIKHVLRNSWIPFLSYLGPLSVSMISGSFLVELLFAIPGLGSVFINALNDRDQTLILGLTLFYGALLILINMLIDFLIQLTDPRIRESL